MISLSQDGKGDIRKVCVEIDLSKPLAPSINVGEEGDPDSFF